MSGGGMKLDTLEFRRLLPSFMRGDLAILGLSDGLDAIVPELAESIKLLTTWDHIADLNEEELDALAWELNILWYDKSASLDTKRDLILNSDQVYQRLGTKWAVESVIKSYFGDGYIEEWFQYDGEPGYFRVYSNNPTLNAERMTAFLNILEKVKRHSSKLDSIYINLTGELKLAAGIAVAECARETYKIGATPIT